MSAGRSIIDELIITTTASLGGKRSLPYMDRKKYDHLQPEANESHGTKLSPKKFICSPISNPQKKGGLTARSCCGWATPKEKRNRMVPQGLEPWTSACTDSDISTAL